MNIPEKVRIQYVELQKYMTAFPVGSPGYNIAARELAEYLADVKKRYGPAVANELPMKQKAFINKIKKLRKQNSNEKK